MAKWLGDPDLKVWYMDTDSIITDSTLPSDNELGGLKLETQYKEATFLSPKVYGGINLDNTSFTKVKGFKEALPYSDLKSLLIKDSHLDLNHDKWFKNLAEGSISLKDQVYTLSVTDSKRQLVYKNNIFVNTKPYIINDNKEVINDDDPHH